MPSTFTSNMHLEIMAPGDKSGTWGPTNDSNLKTLERGITGVHALSLSGTVGTLTTQANLAHDDPSLSAIVLLSGYPDAGITLTIPAKPKTYSFINVTSPARDVVITCGVGPAVTLNSNNSAIVACTGAGVYAVGAPGVGGSSATSITSGVFDIARIPVIPLSTIQTIASPSLLGNDDGSSANAQALTPTEVKTMLSLNDADIVTLMGGLTFWTGTQAAYDGIATKSSTTVYFITA